MAILQRTVNGSFTEIYIGGGNGWITQSAPTNFHHFWRQKILGPDESIDDFREVSETEKRQLLDSDAKWIEPSEEFILHWKRKGGPKHLSDYNKETGYLKLYDIDDISLSEAMMIDMVSVTPYVARGDMKAAYAPINGELVRLRPRALFPIGLRMAMCENMFYRNYFIQVLGFDGPHGIATVSGGDNMFSNCTSLRRIEGMLQIIKGDDTFYGCLSLEEVRLRSLAIDVSFEYSPKLSIASIQYMIENRSDTNQITITLHPEAYARVTDEIFAAAAEKQITIAST